MRVYRKYICTSVFGEDQCSVKHSGYAHVIDVTAITKCERFGFKLHYAHPKTTSSNNFASL